MQDAASPALAWARHTWVLPVPPEQPWCEPTAPEALGQQHRLGAGGASPHTGHRASSGTKDSRSCSGVTAPGGLGPTWTRGARTSLGAAGVGGALPSLHPPHPGEVASGGWGRWGHALSPCRQLGTKAPFPRNPRPPPHPGLLDAGFLISVCRGRARRGCSWTEVPTPSASFLLPGFPRPQGEPGRARERTPVL